ncbi:MAG: cardiolipin synthase [Saprospiraceae bacterium]|nr:cardiolipin synthase [Saprospiraceae bacterium]
MPYWEVFIGLYIIYVFYTLRHVFFQVSNPAKTFSWMLFIIFIPLAGIIFYRIIGRSVKRDNFFQQRKTFFNVQDEKINNTKIPRQKLQLANLLNSNNSAAISYDNKVEVLKNGKASFAKVKEDILKSTRSIHLDFYIVESGELLDSYLEVFKVKIQEGVKIRLVYDAFGTEEEYRQSFKELRNIGVEVREFMPYNWIKNHLYLNYRNHRKIIIIDSEIAYTGGMNISDKHVVGDPNLGLWRDTYVRVEGSAAIDFEHVFLSDWFHAGGTEFKIPEYKEQSKGSIPVQVVASGPDSDHQGIMQEYFTLIVNAEEYVYISTPYFIPGEAIRTALKTTALSGVDVRLMIPYNSDSKWMRWCMFTYLEELLVSDVKVYFYHGGFLHNKTVISDDIVSSIGTANVDVRSFESNFEINAIVYDKEITLELKDHFFEDMTVSEQIFLKDFIKRSDRNKFMEPLARLTSPLL